MFESKSGVLFVGGIGFFVLAFLSNAVVPWTMYRDRPEKTVEEMINENVLNQFDDLAERYPEAFAKAYGEAPPPRGEVDTPAADRPAVRAARTAYLRKHCATALRTGRDVYVGEACWHCHSQFVRPVSNEERRWGPVARSWEFNNELQRPVLFGTRRVGPDLSREAGRRGNDWHAVHFFKPRLTSPESIMPEYPWLFEGSSTVEMKDERGRTVRVAGPGQPNARGLGLMTYMQWLGSWLDSYPHYNPAEVTYRREEAP